MKKFFAPGDVILNKSQGGSNGVNFNSFLLGKKGIYIMQASYPSQYGALGHASLYTLINCVGGNCFFNATGGVEYITLWILQ